MTTTYAYAFTYLVVGKYCAEGFTPIDHRLAEVS